MLRESVHHGDREASRSPRGWFEQATIGWFAPRGSPPERSPRGHPHRQHRHEREALLASTTVNSDGSHASDFVDATSPSNRGSRRQSRGSYDGGRRSGDEVWSPSSAFPRSGAFGTPRASELKIMMASDDDPNGLLRAGGGRGKGGGRGDGQTRINDDLSVLSASTPYGSFIRRIRWTRVPRELLLLVTAAVWGGYHPCMRMMFTASGAKPTPSEINFARFSVTAVMCVAQHLITQYMRRHDICGDGDASEYRGHSGGGGSMPSGGSNVGGASEVGCEGDEAGAVGDYAKDSKPERSYATRRLVVCAAELGFWHALTVGLQSWGVTYTSATRAGFIATTTTMMVPFISVAAGLSISGRIWISSAVVMGGTAIIVYAKGAEEEDDDGNLDHIAYGDALTLLGSFFWAVCLLRLSRLAAELPSGPLVIARSVFIAAFMGIWWAYDEVVGRIEANKAGEVFRSWSWLGSARVCTLILFMAIGPGYVCAWLQTIAQATVPAAKAQILMSSTPLWGAAWAAILLGEKMDVLAWVGGLTIVFGTVLVALEKQE